MKRTIISIIIGSIIGVSLFIPPYVPLLFLFPELSDTFVWALPLLGMFLGSMAGGFVGKNRISLTPFDNVALTIFSWSVWVFWILGMEVGCLLSPVVLIGLGNTFEITDIWIAPFLASIVGTIFGIIFGLFLLTLYFSVKKINRMKRKMNR